MKKKWLPFTLTLLILYIISLFLPNKAFDPWNLFNFKKLISVTLVLGSIQLLSFAILKVLKVRVGALLSGFLGGLISSTATTASIAKSSKTKNADNLIPEYIIFIAANLATTIESVTILIWGLSETHYSLFIIFVLPIILISAFLLKTILDKNKFEPIESFEPDLSILSLLKLATFIFAVITLSVVFKKLVGNSGLFALTFVVSLFEIQGSLIANMQLHNNGTISIETIGTLLAISYLASITSKFFLIMTIGSQQIKKLLIKFIIYLFISVIFSWLFFMYAIRP